MELLYKSVDLNQTACKEKSDKGLHYLFKYSVLLIGVIIGQGPTELAEGACGVVWTIFSSQSYLFSFSFSVGDILI